MKSIAIYYRVSTDMQDFKSQENAVCSWLDQLPPDKKPERILVFQDFARSGKDTKSRKKYLEMLEVIKTGEIDTVVVQRLDRLSRDATTALRTLLDFDALNVAFIAVSQPILNLGHDNPFRRTMLAAFAEIAEIERKMIVDRVKAGLAAARARGVRLGAKQKITPEIKDKMRKARARGDKLKSIAREFSVSVASVHNVLKESLTS